MLPTPMNPMSLLKGCVLLKGLICATPPVFAFARLVPPMLPTDGPLGNSEEELEDAFVRILLLLDALPSGGCELGESVME